MLTISSAISAGQAQTYHAKEFTAKEQSYWSQKQTVEGEWQGKLAEQFGLVGGVGPQEFARLSQGQHPSTSEQLVQHRAVHQYKNEHGKAVTSMEHRAGWDATFSAPKSVSLTALVGGDDRVREAHREAVTVALRELEHYTQARIGSNHPAETTSKFVAAKFEHDTARPVDGYAAPQLHTHAVVFNITERENGQPRALQERALFQSQQFATAVYQSELTYRLSRLGYELAPGRSGAPEIRGYTQEYLDASSPRSQQIREHMEKMGVDSKAAAQIAAHATRDRKQMAGPEATLAAHQRLAADFGNQPQQVIAAAQERAHRTGHAEKKSPVQLAHEAVTFARDRLYEREAVVDERHLFRDALRRGMGEVTYPEMRRAFESRLFQGEFQTAQQSPHASARQITTERMVAMEKEIVQTMQAGQGQASPVLSHFSASQVAERQPHLNRAQQTSIEQVLTSPDRIQAIQGYAGVGKSTALSAIREGAESVGYAVEGFAPTSRAAQQLRDAGISATTLQGFLARGGQEQATGDPAARHFYMLDESSLASTKQVREFLHKVGPQDMVLLVGDIRQHQAVEAGKPFEQLQQAGMRTAQLDQIVRQKDPELLKVVEHLSKADVVTGIRMLQEQGRVTEIPDRTERIEAIAKNYAANPEKTLIVSPDNASRRDINQAVHIELQQRGHVAREDYPTSVLVQRSEMTGADRAWASRYQVGDVLRYQRGSAEIGIQAANYASVLATNPKENTLTVRKGTGEEITYNPARLRGIDAYATVERNFSVGDRIQFTAPSRELQIANRALGTVERIEAGAMTVKMDTGKTVSFDPQVQRHFDHGYAVTSHSSQGLTADRVLINVDGNAHPELLNNRFAYVAVSRGAMDAQVFTDRIADLEKRLGKDVSKSVALDLSQAIRPDSVPSIHHEPAPSGNTQGLGISL
jgi:conjugative relaxase-like TrwC/TraI family protein